MKYQLKFTLVLFGLTLMSSTLSFAQNSFNFNKKAAERVQEKTMIFVIKDLAKVKGPNKKLWADYISKFETAVKSSWKFNEHIEFKTLAEITELKKTKDKNYCLLYLKTYGKGDIDLSPSYFYNGTSGRSVDQDNNGSVLFFSWIENFKPEHWMENVHGSGAYTMITLPHAKLSISDIYAGLYLAQEILYHGLENLKDDELENIKIASIKRLADKTLLVPKDLIGSGASFVGNYPYKYKIVSGKDLNDYFENRDSNYVFLEIFPFIVESSDYQSISGASGSAGTSIRSEQTSISYYYYIFNVATGEILVNSNQNNAPFYGGSIFGTITNIKYCASNKLNNKIISGLASDKVISPPADKQFKQFR